MRAGRTFALLLMVLAVAIPVDAPAKLISLDERCRCAGEWRDHTHYVRCIKRNAKRYLRFEAWVTRPNGRRRIPKAELRAAAKARVTQALASRCGMAEYLCDADRPCAAGEICDIRGCDATVGVCVPVPESCPAEVTLRCTCGSAEDPFGRTYANDCERIRAGARLDTYSTLPYSHCEASCGGPEGLTCPDDRVCLYPDRTCGVFEEHGRCSAPPTNPGGAICGCDRTTYPTRDSARQAGVRVAYDGECGELCGGPPEHACFPGEWCMKDWGSCDDPTLWGYCRAVTDRTRLDTGPVCGCDGELYPRACDAVFAGTDVAGYPIDGACAAP